MKYFKKIIFLSTLIISLLMTVSCESILDESQEVIKESEFSIETNNYEISIPEIIGVIHNHSLDNILFNKENFDFDTDTTDLKKQIIKENNIYLQQQISSLDIEIDLNLLEIFYSEQYHLKLLNTESILSVNFGDRFNEESFSIDKSNIDEKIEFLYSSNVISELDKNTLTELFTYYKNNIEGIITDEEFINEANWLKQNFYSEISFNNEEHIITLSIIEIATASLNWANNNLNLIINPENEVKAIPGIAWIAGADAVGAVVGIAEGIIASAIINGTNQPVDGTSVAVGALISAATSSLGAAVKVAGWLGKLYKFLG